MKILLLLFLSVISCEEYSYEEYDEYDYEIWNIGAEILYIPHQTMSYSSRRLISIPFQSKRQIFKINAVIQPKNVKYIENVYLFRCTKSVEPLSDSRDDRLEWIANRVITDYQNQEYQCWKLLAVWSHNDSVNKTVLSLPKTMGIPIDGQNSNEKYILFEINYKNSDPIEELSDSSGFELYVHKQNTEIDADIVVVGSVPDYRFFIPPKMNEWTITGNCYKECLQNNLYYDGINVLDVIHYSKSNLLKELRIEINNMNKDSEEIITLMSSLHNKTSDYIDVKLRNEDQVMVKCKYSSINQSKTVLGGMSGDSAQCMAWIVYYPKIQDFDVCLSSFSLTTIMSITGIDQMEEKWRTENDFDIVIKTVNNNQTERLEDYLIRKNDWDHRRANRAKYVAQFGKQTAQCNWKRSFFDQIL